MTRLSRFVALAIAVAGLALVATAFQGLVKVDGTLQAATRDMRQQQKHMLDVRYHPAPGCPVVEPQRS